MPYKFAGRTARLQIRDTALSVFVGNELICRHEIIPGHGKVSRNKDHFKGLLSEILKQNSVQKQKARLSSILAVLMSKRDRYPFMKHFAGRLNDERPCL